MGSYREMVVGLDDDMIINVLKKFEGSRLNYFKI